MVEERCFWVLRGRRVKTILFYLIVYDLIVLLTMLVQGARL